MTTVELVLKTGSNAGVTAVIHEGYYLIGRHPECQIRPKSKSVSRRHCLIHHAAGVVRVFDLQSTSGTIVNATRLEPKHWRTLQNDDQVRCGKVVFQLSIASGREATKARPENSMSAGEAWHDVDVAMFLNAEDEADREIRYQQIREGVRNESREEVDKQRDTTSDTTPDTEVESIEAMEEAFADDEGAVSRPPTAPRPDDGKNRGKRHSKKPKQPAPLPKLKRPKKTRNVPGISLSSLRDTERMKMIGVALLSISVLGFFGYRIYQFSMPTPMRVVEELKY